MRELLLRKVPTYGPDVALDMSGPLGARDGDDPFVEQVPIQGHLGNRPVVGLPHLLHDPKEFSDRGEVHVAEEDVIRPQRVLGLVILVVLPR